MLKEYIDRHILWSIKTFGAGNKTKGIVKHIKQELEEVEEAPGDVFEWVDVIILAIDGAWRNGHTSDEIVKALEKKQKINFFREWNSAVDDEPKNRVRFL